MEFSFLYKGGVYDLSWWPRFNNRSELQRSVATYQPSGHFSRRRKRKCISLHSVKPNERARYGLLVEVMGYMLTLALTLLP